MSSSYYSDKMSQRLSYFPVFIERIHSRIQPPCNFIVTKESVYVSRVELPQDWFGTPTWPPFHRAFSHDVTAAILVFQKIETAAMLVYQTSPVGVDLFSYVNTVFCSNKFAWLLNT